MLARRTPDTAGFTIMETLIVLAVAGLILLMVLQALPTLQRNSRNSQRKQGVQTILQAVSNYELNNSGTVPNQAKLRSFLTSYEINKLAYYAPTDVHVTLYAASDAVVYYTNPSTIDTVVISNHAKCVPASSQFTNLGAGYSDVVAMYTIETSGGTAGKCQQL